MKKTKILIIRFSSIGDIVLTTPVPRALKTQLDNAEIHFCTKKQYALLLQNNPYIDRLHILDRSLKELVSGLKAERFDVVIDLHHNLRTRLIKWKLGVKSYSFNKLNWEKWLYVNLKINRLPNVHIVDRYMETVKPLGVKKDSLGLDYFIPDEDKVDINSLPEPFRREYVAFVIGATYATKRLPADKMIQLCHQINKPIILLGGPLDFAEGEKIKEFFHDQDPQLTQTMILNACGKYNLNQSASLVKQANHVFSHDTGLMHIAAAFKKEVFTIWGNTTPRFGMYPYKTKFTVFENNNLSCRPCSKLGFGECPKKHFKCMNDQKFDFYLP